MVSSIYIAIALFHITTSFGLNMRRQEDPTGTAPASVTGIQTPRPHQAGMTANCNKFHKIVSGDDCVTLARDYGISRDEFWAWNPTVHKPSCDNLYPNTYVCVGIVSTSTSPTPTPGPTSTPKPSPIQPGTVDYCQKYYKVQSGDYCFKVADLADILLADFYTWNPEIDSVCSNLLLGFWVCIGI